MNSKKKANEILKKFAAVQISIAIDEYPYERDTNLGEEDRKVVVACALLLVEEMISAKVSPDFWKEVKKEILDCNTI